MVSIDPFDLATETRFATVEQIIDKALSLIDADPDVLEQAIGRRDPHAATAALRSAAMARVITDELPAALGRQLHVAGAEEAKGSEVVVRKAAATIAWRFDLNVQQAIRWAEQKAAGLVVEIDVATRDAIRALVVRAMAEGGHPYAVARDVRGLIGLHSRWALAVYNKQLALEAAGIAPARVAEITSAYYSSLLKTRSETIARTEILDASNQGRLAAWADAIAQGYLAPDVTKTWLVAPDCSDPNCLDVADQEVGVMDDFTTPLGPMTMPPMHPNCRCTATLNVDDGQIDVTPEEGAEPMTADDLLALLPSDIPDVVDEAALEGDAIAPVGEGFSGGDAAWVEQQAAEATRAQAADVAARAQAEREAVAREAATRQEAEAQAERDAARAVEQKEGGLPEGKTIADKRLRDSGGNEGINASWRGHIEGDGQVIIKPTSGFYPKQLRAGIEQGSDIANEVAAYRVNEQLGGLVRMGVTEDRNAFVGTSSISDRAVVQEYLENLGNMQDVVSWGGVRGWVYVDPAGDAIKLPFLEADVRSAGIFDGIIGNLDRHFGNAMLSPDHHLLAIDHGLSFVDGVARALDLTNDGVAGVNARFMAKAIELTDDEVGMLEKFESRKLAVSEELRSVGLSEGSIDSMWSRVRYMIEHREVPAVSKYEDPTGFWLLSGEGVPDVPPVGDWNATFDYWQAKWTAAAREQNIDPTSASWWKDVPADFQAALIAYNP